jgi:hypothetical protein
MIVEDVTTKECVDLVNHGRENNDHGRTPRELNFVHSSD